MSIVTFIIKFVLVEDNWLTFLSVLVFWAVGSGETRRYNLEDKRGHLKAPRTPNVRLHAIKVFPNMDQLEHQLWLNTTPTAVISVVFANPPSPPFLPAAIFNYIFHDFPSVLRQAVFCNAFSFVFLSSFADRCIWFLCIRGFWLCTHREVADSCVKRSTICCGMDFGGIWDQCHCGVLGLGTTNMVTLVTLCWALTAVAFLLASSSPRGLESRQPTHISGRLEPPRLPIKSSVLLDLIRGLRIITPLKRFESWFRNRLRRSLVY